MVKGKKLEFIRLHRSRYIYTLLSSLSITLHTLSVSLSIYIYIYTYIHTHTHIYIYKTQHKGLINTTVVKHNYIYCLMYCFHNFFLL